VRYGGAAGSGAPAGNRNAFALECVFLAAITLTTARHKSFDRLGLL
jgi:hypothetical protein